MGKPQLNVAMIGYKFMGKAHSNAFRQVARVMNPDAEPVMKLLVGRTPDALNAAAAEFGWQSTETDWHTAVQREDIDIVDICTANDMHMEIALAALQAGKHVICEKPLAMNVTDATRMAQAAVNAGVKHLVNFNYRTVPAIALAKQLIQEGRIGRIFHWRGEYLQDWIIDPSFPLVWRLDKSVAGSGSHGDLNAHIIDLATWLVGDIAEVSSAMETFVKERPKQAQTTGGLSAAAGEGMGEVTVDDAVISLARFTNGAIGTFEATRFAAGHKNGMGFEINGDKGSIRFNFERMNEVEYFNREDPPHVQGFRTILATESIHPYLQAWWPPGHVLGYEHTFTHQVYNFLNAVAHDTPVHPDFIDGAKVNAVLDAMSESAETRKWIDVPEIKITPRA
ncbi:MAG TPA: Gfo/Idh/MocA family oxidoreductase [Armatimonadota bacterium]|jgi:predicted dehydrogenase